MPNLLIASPNNLSYSETFIRNQNTYLEHKVLLTGGWYPYVHNKKSIFSGLLKFNFFRGIVRRFSPNYYHNLYSKNLTRFLKKNQITKVLAHYGKCGVSVMDACKNADVELIVHFHGFDAFHIETLNEFGSKYSQMFKVASKIIAVSNDMREQLIKLGSHPEITFCQPYGVDIEKFKPIPRNESNKNLLFVGRLTAKKAPLILLKSFERVLTKHPDAHLTIIGNGELEAEVIAYINSQNLEVSVSLLGVRSPQEIITKLQTSDIFVQHSIHADNGDSEGTPNTILEASACGLPIVSTFHGGIKEAVVHNLTGLLSEERDAELFAENIIDLLNNSEKRQKMGEFARKHMVENYSLKENIEKLKRIIYQ